MNLPDAAPLHARREAAPGTQTMRRTLGECALMAAGAGAYFGVRALTQSSATAATRNALRLVAVERSTGLAWEPQLQAALLRDRALVDIANWIYIWGHWPVIIVAGLWLLTRHRATYLVIRNAFFVSGAIGLLVFVLFPVAPPRLALSNVSDTVSLYSHAYRVLQPPALEDRYASLPSLHVGWNLLIGLGVAHSARHRLVKLAGLASPVVMAAAVVLTANHYTVDVLAGVGVALIGLAVSTGSPAVSRCHATICRAAPHPTRGPHNWHSQHALGAQSRPDAPGTGEREP